MSLYFIVKSREAIPQHLTPQGFAQFVLSEFQEELIPTECGSHEHVWKFTCEDYLFDDDRFESIVYKNVTFVKANLIRIGRTDGSAIYSEVVVEDVLNAMQNVTEGRICPVETVKFAPSWLFECPSELTKEFSVNTRFFPKPKMPLWVLETFVKSIRQMIPRTQSLMARQGFLHALPKVASAIPESAEKSIVKILEILTFESNRGLSKTNVMEPRKVNDIFDRLAEQFVQEEYFDEEGVFESAKNMLLAQGRDAQEFLMATANVQAFLNSVRPLDLDALSSRLGELVLQDDLLKGRDVILLVGSGRAGCTSAVHYLCQSSFTKKTIGGVDHFEPSQVSESLKTFVTSPWPKTETKMANFVPLPNYPGHLVVCDCPAIGSADSALEDITRCVELARNLRLCASVRPVLVMSREALTMDFRHVTDMFTSVNKLMPNLRDNVTRQMSYVFTKFPKGASSEEMIYQQLEAKEQSLTAEEKFSVGHMFSDVCLKTKYVPNILDLLNNQGDQRDYLVQSFLNRKSDIDPVDEYADCASQSSMEILHRQLIATRVSFTTALHHHNVAIATHKLNQLGAIHNQLIVSECRNVYRGAVRLFATHLGDLNCTLEDKLERLTKFSSSFDDDLADCFEVMSKLNDLEAIRRRHLNPEICDSVADANLIESNCATISEINEALMRAVTSFESNYVGKFRHMYLLTERVKQFFSNEKMTSLVSSLNTVLDSLDMPKMSSSITLFADGVTQQFETARRSLVTMVESKLAAVVSAAKNFNYPQSLSNIIALKSLADGFQEIEGELSIGCAGLLESASQVLEAAVLADIASCVQCLGAENVAELHKNLHRVLEVRSSVAYGAYISMATVNKALEDFFEQCNVLIQTVGDAFAQQHSDAVDSKPVKPFAYMKERLDFLAILRASPQLAVKTEDVHSELLSTVRQNIKELASDISDEWESKISITNGAIRLSMLQQAQCLADDNSLYNGELEEILKFWGELANGHNDEVMRVKTFDLSHVKNFVTPFHLTSRIVALLTSSNLGSCSVSKCEKFHKSLNGKIGEIVKTLRPVLNLSITKSTLVGTQGNLIYSVMAVYEACVGYHVSESSGYAVKKQIFDEWKVESKLTQLEEGYFEHITEVKDKMISLLEVDLSDEEEMSTRLKQCKASVKSAKPFTEYLAGFSELLPSNPSRLMCLIRDEAQKAIVSINNEKLLPLLLQLEQRFKSVRQNAEVAKYQAECDFVMLLTPFDTVISSTKNSPFQALVDEYHSIISATITSGYEKIQYYISTGKNYQELSAKCAELDTSSKEHGKLADIVTGALEDKIHAAQESKCTSVDDKRLQYWLGLNSLFVGIGTVSKYVSKDSLRTDLQAMIQSEMAFPDEWRIAVEKKISNLDIADVESDLQRMSRMLAAGVADDRFANSLFAEVITKLRSAGASVRSQLDEELARHVSGFRSIPRDLDFGHRRESMNKLFAQLMIAASSFPEQEDNIYSRSLLEISALVCGQVDAWLAIKIVGECTTAAVLASLGEDKYTIPQAQQVEARLAKSIASNILPDSISAKILEMLSAFHGRIARAIEEDQIITENKESLSKSFKKFYDDQSARTHTVFMNKVNSMSLEYGNELTLEKFSTVVINIRSFWIDCQKYLSLMKAARGDGGADTSSVSPRQGGKKKNKTQRGQEQASNLASAAPSNDIFWNSAIACVEDNWKTLKIAILKIIDSCVLVLDESNAKNAASWTPSFSVMTALLTLKVERVEANSETTQDSFDKFYAEVVDGGLEKRCKGGINKLAQLFKQWSTTITKQLSSIGLALSPTGSSDRNGVTAASTDDKSLRDLFTKMNATFDMIHAQDSLLSALVTYGDSEACSLETPEISAITKECQSHDCLRSILVTNAFQWQKGVMVSISDSKYINTPNGTDRDTFYNSISAGYNVFTVMASIGSNLAVDVTFPEENKPDARFSVLLRIFADAAKNEICAMEELQSEAEDHAKFNMSLDNIRSVGACFDNAGLRSVAASCASEVNRDFKKMISALVRKATITDWDNWEKSIFELSRYLLGLKKLSLEIPSFGADIKKCIDNILKTYSESTSGFAVECINAFGRHFLQLAGQCPYAKLLISDHNAFEHCKLVDRNRTTAGITIYSLLGFKDPKSTRPAGQPLLQVDQKDPTNFSKLLELYEMFDDEYYKGLVEPTITSNVDLATIVSSAYDMAAATTLQYEVKIVALMARVFAFWSVANFRSGQQHSVVREGIQQPHATQVVSIMRLFRLDASESYRESTEKAVEEAAANKAKDSMLGSAWKYFSGAKTQFSPLCLENHMVEIGTGEGKSITLAVTSTIMALLGYHVDCACYSEHLSNRDMAAFEPLFTAFKVKEHIVYGTFNKLCESFLNEGCNIRETAINMISNSNVANAQSDLSQIRPRVLLIDEVDVFISKDFYGNSYKPAAKLQHPTISTLVRYIWSIRENPTELRNVIQSEQCKACLKRYAGWEPLILESVKKILMDLKTRAHDYHTDNKEHRIGYKNQDAISFKAVVGYKTMFAYFEQFEQSFPSCIEDQIALVINCGSFSYGEVPKLYKFVVGVTGTLRTLIAEERKLLEDVYAVKQYTYIPSMYGKNQRNFAPDAMPPMIKIEEEANYYSGIVNEIKEYARGPTKRRAVLVFFKTAKVLADFQNCEAFEPLRNTAAVITEATSKADMDSAVQQAISRSKITLLTKEFGRGTDFVCNDNGLNTDGGLHVIQTFVSEEISEEIQIMGRTARQGNKGSFSMVLLNSELEQVSVFAPDIETMVQTNTRGTTITAKRNAKYIEMFNERTLNMDEIKADHEQSQLFVSDLNAKHVTSVQQYLLAKNRCKRTEEAAASRTIVLMDATGSMGNTLEKSKRAVTLMFKRVFEILEEKKIPNSFELQFVAYRNYSSGPVNLLQCSTWESEPDNLHDFITSVAPLGGQGNEAMEIGLWHVNQELLKGSVSQVVVIGDAPPNNVTNVTKKRATTDWSTSPFAVPTYYKDELQPLIGANIPVHAFYVGDHAATQTSFEEIASLTHGVCKKLMIDSSEGAEMLTGLVTSRVLEDVGTKLFGAAKGAELKKAYAEAYNFTE